VGASSDIPRAISFQTTTKRVSANSLGKYESFCCESGRQYFEPFFSPQIAWQDCDWISFTLIATHSVMQLRTV
jgi:hypothetical protein